MCACVCVRKLNTILCVVSGSNRLNCHIKKVIVLSYAIGFFSLKTFFTNICRDMTWHSSHRFAFSITNL